MKKLVLITFSILIFGLAAQAQEPATSTERGPFAAEAEVGIVSANGNTRASSSLVKNITSYSFDAYLAKFSGSYLRNESRDNATDTFSSYEKWEAGLKLERELTDRLSLFIGQNVESDKDAGADRRYNTDAGVKYYIAKKDGYYTFTEVGYRFANEHYTDGSSAEINFARIYIESEKLWKPTLSTKLWMEYLPNVEESEDYGANAELSVNAALDNMFSIKTAYLAKYTNLPVTEHRTDTLLSTSLIAKF